MDHYDYLFVVNPIAGGVSKAPFYEFIHREQKNFHFTYQIYETTGNNDDTGIEQILTNHRFRSVIAVGGDGTLLQVAKLLQGRDYNIGILPFGSANGMATNLRISMDMEEAWKTILRKKIRKIDLININEDYYSLHLSDVGLNARIVKRFEQEKMRGRIGYLRQFLKELPLSKMLKYNLQVDNNRFTGRAYMVVFANAREYGTGAIINPLGELDDGKFEVCLVKSISLRAMILAFVSIFKKDIKYKTLLVHSCREARINFRRKQTLQIDGEVIGEVSQVVARIVPSCIKILV